MSEIEDNSISLMVTSPPYNVGMEYEEKLNFSDYLNFLNEVWKVAKEKLIPGGRFAINVANTGRNPYIPLSSYIPKQLLDLGMVPEGEIIWQKPVANSFGSCAWGSWLMPSNPILEDRHEYILIFRKDERRRKINLIPNELKERSRLQKDDFLNLRSSTWQIRPAPANGHPCPFPEELPNRLIRLYTFIGDIVLDPFMGGGTSASAALQLGRNFLGYEIVSNYCQTAQQRGLNIKYFSNFDNALDTGLIRRDSFNCETNPPFYISAHGNPEQ